ncbi:hypothetical protein, partial [Paraglaciecola sp.]|uniref:hypothetical protein n=1 Tax=Paraglaciecola sp. TaxID=1920173 RepID=UPI003EF3EB6E
SLVNIHSINKGQENLYYGEASQLIHWSQSEKQTQDKSLSQSLESLFEQDSMLKDLYFDHPLKNTTWVVARWLELLPIKLEIKDSFVKNRNYREAKNFVQSIIFK